MPPKKMLITQNLVFNAPFALVMNIVSTIGGGGIAAVFTPFFLLMYLIAFVMIEALGFIIPVQKIAGAVGGKVAPRKNPMEFPQFFAVAAVLTVIFTVLMTAGMTAVALLFQGDIAQFPLAFQVGLPPMLIAAYICVLIFLPLSMKVSGLGEFTARQQQEHH